MVWRRPTVEARFETWLNSNGHVYDLFKRFAREAMAAGLQRYSADAILHRIRWFTRVESRHDDFKCNNDYTASMARLLMEEDPAFVGFFETRVTAAEREANRRAAPPGHLI